MGAGIEVRNNTGNLVIDSTFKNLVYITKGSVATGTAVDTFSWQSVNLNGLSGYPLVAVQSTAGAWATVRSYSNGASVVDIVAHGPVNTQVNYYVFALPTVRPTDNGGLEIYDATGALVFSGGYDYMKVMGRIDDDANIANPPASLTLPTGKSYAVMQTSPIAFAKVVNQSSVPSQQDWYLYSFRACFSVNSNVITGVKDEFQIVHYGTTVPPNYGAAGSGFILDVTNF